jgi:hypothetical protein
MVPTKARKVVMPEVTEHSPPEPIPVIPELGPTRRSRAATKSTESTTTENEVAERSKSTRKTARRTKAAAPTAPAASPEPDVKRDQEAETTKGSRRGGWKRSQSVEVAPAPVPAPPPATSKRRVGAKSKKTADATATQDAPVEDCGPGSTADRASSPEAPPVAARARRGKTKPAAETEDSGASTGALRVARGRRTPTGTGAASNRAPAGKGRAVAVAVAVAVVIPTSAKSAARAVAGEKENMPERAHVKEEEDDKVALPPVAAKGVRARKGAAVVVQKAQSEPEKDTAVAKTRAPRTRAASGRT